MKRTLAVIVAAAAAVGCVVAARVALASADRPGGKEPAKSSTSPVQPPNTGYWTPERMQSAKPAPMPDPDD
ncbi:hypothetical protein [Actinomadura atramentaria]|uniref:hypothetical protein n=1 Tax=Actinomadura atramentaria TaxID=1990 RepID=UPI00037C05E2|nr:hypothetical protein [Actinomadura atramentaria]